MPPFKDEHVLVSLFRLRLAASPSRRHPFTRVVDYELY